jgi:hypothetical protein
MLKCGKFFERVEMEITASVLNSILKDALTVLSIEKNRINDLNVFPVPDGDTGLNWFLRCRVAWLMPKIMLRPINFIGIFNRPCRRNDTK